MPQPSPRQTLANKSLDEIADFMSGVTAGSINDQAAKAEFLLRQTQFQQQATDATIQTATETQRYTRYMFWSVVILAVSSVLSFGINLVTYLGSSSSKQSEQVVTATSPAVVSTPATSNITVEMDASPQSGSRPSP